MNQPGLTRYGWLVALLVVGAVCLRVGNFSVPQVQASPEALDGETKPFPATVVAVVDVAKIYKKYDKFDTKMAEIKADIASFDEYVKTSTAELAALGEKYKLLPAGSDEAAQAELQLKQATFTLQTKVEQKKANLLKQEAEVYYDSYLELEKAVKLESRKRGVTLVLRISTDSMNRVDRASVLQGVNRAIVYAQDSYDLTDNVIKTLNGG